MVEYSPEIADEICRRMADGESLSAICRDPHMPRRETVHQWINDNRDGLGNRYARARMLRADHYANEQVDIADSVRGCTDHAVVAAAKLAIESRRWIAARLDPRNFGDRVNHDHGSDPERPVVNRIEVAFVKPPDRGS